MSILAHKGESARLTEGIVWTTTANAYKLIVDLIINVFHSDKHNPSSVIIRWIYAHDQTKRTTDILKTIYSLTNSSNLYITNIYLLTRDNMTLHDSLWFWFGGDGVVFVDKAEEEDARSREHDHDLELVYPICAALF